MFLALPWGRFLFGGCHKAGLRACCILVEAVQKNSHGFVVLTLAFEGPILGG